MRARSIVMPLIAGARYFCIGVPAAFSDVCVAANIPASHKELLTPIGANWTALDVVNRKRLLPLTSAYAGNALTSIKAQVASSPPKPAKGAKQLFKTNVTPSITALVTFYEETMLPIRKLADEMQLVQLEIYGLKDHLKLGMSVFKPEQLEQKQKKLQERSKDLAATKQQFDALVADSFDTDVFNDIINALRICGSQYPEAIEMAERVLEDMALCQIAFDESTKLLLKNVLFGDGPYEDSGLLFAFVEYPERGEISVSRAPLEKIADEAIVTISKRHQTPITEGKLLRSPEAHPNLQRSVE